MRHIRKGREGLNMALAESKNVAVYSSVTSRLFDYLRFISSISSNLVEYECYGYCIKKVSYGYRTCFRNYNCVFSICANVKFFLKHFVKIFLNFRKNYLLELPNNFAKTMIINSALLYVVTVAAYIGLQWMSALRYIYN